MSDDGEFRSFDVDDGVVRVIEFVEFFRCWKCFSVEDVFVGNVEDAFEIRAKCFAVDLIVEIGDMSFSARGTRCDGERVVDSQVCEF